MSVIQAVALSVLGVVMFQLSDYWLAWTKTMYLWGYKELLALGIGLVLGVAGGVAFLFGILFVLLGVAR